jgi:hypothetical protein
MEPRGAGARNVRTWLLRASLRYCSPEMTWSAQSRKKRTPKMVTAKMPRIAIRRASCGVRR